MKPIDRLFTEIAREHLGIETLESRGRDSLDFHDVSVWGVKAALQAAYGAGVNAAASRRDKARAAPPTIIVTVRGGCVMTIAAGIPLLAMLEDWDCEDRTTGKKPYRAALPVIRHRRSKAHD